MNKQLLQEKIRAMIPENRWIRRKLTDLEKYLFDRGYLSSGEIRRARGNKKELVEKWERKHPRAAASLNRDIEKLRTANSAAAERINTEEYLTDMKYCYCAFGFPPYEFVNFELFTRTEEERRQFMSEKDKTDMAYQLTDLKAMSLFNDKWETYSVYKKYYHRDCIAVEKESDFAGFQAFAGRHPVFFMKQVYGSCGISVKRADMSSCPETLRELFDGMIRKGKHIVEEPIRQSTLIAVFNDSSVNTVRFATILTKQGPEALTSFMRTGRAGSAVDNGGSGGIFAGVDTETGIVYTPGVDESGRRYEKHPDSGVVYQGYQLPDWEQLVSICTEASATAGKKGCRYVGWDLAYTEGDGWVIVEGNPRGQLLEQCASRKGIRRKAEALMAKIQ